MDFFKDKKVTLMGLGLLGRGIGDARFLVEHGAQLLVTDLKTEEQLASALESLKGYTDITYHLGGHILEDFRDTDMVIKAAGVPLNSVYIQEARSHGVPVYMSSALFVKLAGVPIIGITGTKGKTTVTHLIYEILQSAGKEVVLGGNIQGVSTLALLDTVTLGSIAVLELDSWQLQGFGDLEISPDIAVFTNLLPDHLNYYKGDMGRYFADKANIYQFQDANDVLIAGSDIAKRIQGAEFPVHGKMIIPEALPRSWELSLVGEHNRFNAALACEVAQRLEVNDTVIRNALKSFTGVPGRLEKVREYKGITYYCDTTATMPDAVVAALRALEKDKNIILIAGGADKNSPDASIKELARVIEEKCKTVLLLKGSGTERLKTFLSQGDVHDSLDSAFAKTQELADAGDIVLLSPGFASFGMFTNEYDRGERFVTLVRAL